MIEGPAGLEGAECGAGGPLGGLGTQRDGRDESHLAGAFYDGRGLCGLGGVASLLGDGVGAGGPLGGLGTQRDGRDESHLTGALCDGWGLCGLDAWLRLWAMVSGQGGRWVVWERSATGGMNPTLLARFMTGGACAGWARGFALGR